MDSTSAPEPTACPPGLLLAAALAGLEGAAVLALAVIEVLHLTPGRGTMGATTAVFFAAYGAGLIWCAWGLTRRSSWARGPVAMAQLIQLGLAWSFRDQATAVVSVVLTVAAVVALVALLTPGSRAALET